ncbi:MAG: hypothetical protein ACHQF2_03210 [Flavobacteriales bacterium]
MKFTQPIISVVTLLPLLCVGQVHAQTDSINDVEIIYQLPGELEMANILTIQNCNRAHWVPLDALTTGTYVSANGKNLASGAYAIHLAVAVLRYDSVLVGTNLRALALLSEEIGKPLSPQYTRLLVPHLHPHQDSAVTALNEMLFESIEFLDENDRKSETVLRSAGALAEVLYQLSVCCKETPLPEIQEFLIFNRYVINGLLVLFQKYPSEGVEEIINGFTELEKILPYYTEEDVISDFTVNDFNVFSIFMLKLRSTIINCTDC